MFSPAEHRRKEGHRLPAFRRPCSSWCQILIVVAIVALVAAPFIAARLILWPQKPTWKLTSVSISPFNIVDSAELTAVWNLTFEIKNPNRRSLSYEDVKLYVYYQNEANGASSSLLATANQTSFRQSKVSSSTYQFDAWVSSLVVADGLVNASDIAGDFKRGAVPFLFQVHAKLSYDILPLISWRHHKNVTCANVTVGVGKDDNLFNVITGGFGRCHVDW